MTGLADWVSDEDGVPYDDDKDVLTADSVVGAVAARPAPKPTEPRPMPVRTAQ